MELQRNLFTKSIYIQNIETTIKLKKMNKPLVESKINTISSNFFITTKAQMVEVNIQHFPMGQCALSIIWEEHIELPGMSVVLGTSESCLTEASQFSSMLPINSTDTKNN